MQEFYLLTQSKISRRYLEIEFVVMRYVKNVEVAPSGRALYRTSFFTAQKLNCSI